MFLGYCDCDYCAITPQLCYAACLDKNKLAPFVATIVWL